MANMYKKTTFGNGCEYQVSRLVVQTKPNRYNSDNFHQLSKALTAFTNGWLRALAAHLTRLHHLFNSFDQVSTVLSQNF